jgi:prophage regulatory protein
MPIPTLLSREDLKAHGISYSRAQIYRKVKDGTFPAPVKLGANKVAWLSIEIDAWIKAIAEARPAQPTSEAA